MAQIIYTITDEAPALATRSFLPIISSFLEPHGISIDTKDISLAARILSAFPEFLLEDQQIENCLDNLANIVKNPHANIIKLPNISASIPQLKQAITELQSKGYDIPNYPENPLNKDEVHIKIRYDKIKGSAVNPVLREGNSDRRAPRAVKNYAKMNPHIMGEWKVNSKTHVATMKNGDFANNEQSITSKKSTKVSVYLKNKSLKKTVFKKNISILKGEIFDASIMSINALKNFLKTEIKEAKDSNILLSVHMKSTMMKVSDPIIFGHVLKVFFKNFLEKNAKILKDLNVNLNSGLSNLYEKINTLEETEKSRLISELEDEFNNGPDVSMVNSEKNISNFHIPSDVIIDASMPAMIKSSGKLWDKKGNLKDTKAIIPDSSYASIYQATIDFCKKNGEFDPATMGTVQNVGLMAKKAEEYGSHDKTFEIKNNGKVCVETKDGKTLFTHEVIKGDIWRMCIVRNEAILDWIKLAIERARTTNYPTVFWLDEKRSHDKQLIKIVKSELDNMNISGLDVKINSPYEATVYTLDKVKKGKSVISVSGNVLRDYLTDLFPILELGTSAKMLSIVPLMNGGKLFETGAGGSAPKHVEQLINENHLRWDSLGEFLAISVALEEINNSNSKILSKSLTIAIEKLLKNKKSPSRKVKEIDNRGSHFYLAYYWAEELSKQKENINLNKEFTKVYEQLSLNEEVIMNEINEKQGDKIDLNGYYKADENIVNNIMRPSTTLNHIIENI